MVNSYFHSSILESGKLWPSTGAIAGNDSFVAMYEGLGHKCIHLLQLISKRIIRQVRNKRLKRNLKNVGYIDKL